MLLVTGLRRPQRGQINAARLIIISMLGLLLTIPILLNRHEPAWTGILKSLPLFGNSSTLIRWICLYIPLVILISMLIVERAEGLKRARPGVALVIVACVITHNMGIDRQHYAKQGDFDFTAVETACAAARRGAPVPPVSRVEWSDVSKSGLMTLRNRNDSLMRGGTNAQCFEPMFGHRLEDYSYISLREGPTLRSENGILNIKNPACMQYPDANECRPGDHFASSELAAAQEFVNYRPFPFPWWQTLANWISLVTFLIVVAGLVAFGARRIGWPLRPIKLIPFG